MLSQFIIFIKFCDVCLVSWTSTPHPSWLKILVTPLSIRLRYDSVHLTCSKKLTGSQLSLPHGRTPELSVFDDVMLWSPNLVMTTVRVMRGTATEFRLLPYTVTFVPPLNVYTSPPMFTCTKSSVIYSISNWQTLPSCIVSEILNVE